MNFFRVSRQLNISAFGQILPPDGSVIFVAITAPSLMLLSSNALAVGATILYIFSGSR